MDAPRRRKSQRKSRRTDELCIRDEAQVRALASPVRQAIVNFLRRGGPASIREAAVALGREPATLYYHARLLEQVGLIVEVERRKTGRRPEAVYRLVADQIRLDRRRGDEAWHKEVDRLVRTHLRALERALAQALRNEELDADDPDSLAHFRAQRARLNAEDRRGLQDRLNELSTFLDEATERAGEDDPVLTSVLACAPSPDVSL